MNDVVEPPPGGKLGIFTTPQSQRIASRRLVNDSFTKQICGVPPIV